MIKMEFATNPPIETTYDTKVELKSGGSGKCNHLLPFESKVTVGSFTPATDITGAMYISHNEEEKPYAIFLWTKEIQLKKDGVNLTHKFAGMYIQSSDISPYFSCFSGVTLPYGAIATSTGDNSAVYRIYPTEDKQIFIGASSFYALKAGVEYLWEARWL